MASYLPDDTGDYEAICDVVLVVEGESLPVHSGILGLHSLFFRKMIKDLASNEGSEVDGKLVIPLDETVLLKDAETMLQILYGVREHLETDEEARRMVFMGDKYDVSILCKLAEKRLSESAEGFYFVKSRQASDDSDDQKEAAQWLGIAERLGMHNLKEECQFVILRDLVSCIWSTKMSAEMDAALDSLKVHGVSARSMAEVAAAAWNMCCSAGFEPLKLNQYCCTNCRRVSCIQNHDKLEEVQCPGCKQFGGMQFACDYLNVRKAKCIARLQKYGHARRGS
eukprot:evm.model.scf_1411.3 EVM.evm.TU.scf_1411.3   scf_1411:15082-16158(+)